MLSKKSSCLGYVEVGHLKGKFGLLVRGVFPFDELPDGCLFMPVGYPSFLKAATGFVNIFLSLVVWKACKIDKLIDVLRIQWR